MRYAAGKIVTMLVTMAAVSLFVFLSFDLISGDSATAMLGIQATPERLAALRTELGLDRSLPIRYLDWLGSFVSGDMGVSYSYHIPVGQMVADKIPITLTLSLLAFGMTLLLAIPLGLFIARYADRRVDRILMAAGQVVMAVPPFFAGILLTLLFGLVLRLFTPGGYVPWQEDVPGFIGYMLLPAFAVALPRTAMAVKLLRASILDEAGLDYVRTAYSRGNSTRQVLYGHVLKNAMIPLITFLGMTLSDMIAGSVIIEQVFGIPGLSNILLASISNRDYPVVMAIIMCMAGLVLVVNMAVDLIYGIADPRIQGRQV